ncbi:MAG TPA: tetratricopeptide repeat protein, partial [Blastocatellia bacterium]|nr:tetratricopeptide repeat protein [Blastocatellia bacterium]
RLARYEEAIASYDRAIDIKPDAGDVWYNRGNAFAKLGRNKEAIASYDFAIKIEPQDFEAWNNRGADLYDLARYEEAIASYDRAIDIKPDHTNTWYNRALAYLSLFIALMQQNRSETAKQNWNEALASASHLEKEKWRELASWSLTNVAQAGHLKFVRQIVSESELEEPLFPLARAIDYVLTGDEALIEKLSPEVRGIVEEIVITLQKTVDKPNQQKTKSGTAKSIASKKSAAGKSKPSPRRPTKRQLK